MIKGSSRRRGSARARACSPPYAVVLAAGLFALPLSAGAALDPAPHLLTQLEAAINSENFYPIVAEIDPINHARWLRMAETQTRFAAAEGSYGNPGRIYSESMRESLHVALLEALKTPGMLQRLNQEHPRGGLQAWFVQAHPTAFRENGAYRLPLGDAVAILLSTHVEMIRPRNVLNLWRGLWLNDRYARLACKRVREGRRARHLGTTPERCRLR